MPAHEEARLPSDPRPRVFLSYRRQDAAFQVDALYRTLAEAFGPDRVFKDVDSIDVGDDFGEAISRAVASCTVLLAVIGDRWLAAVDPAGRRRLDDPGDLVRLEIESALRAGVRVVPVLLGADLPTPEQLPPSLAALTSRQAVFLSPQGFMSGVQRLVEQLARLRPDGGPPEPTAELVSAAYRMQIADIAPEQLRGRDDELRRLAEFCSAAKPYAWWQAEAWAGKTALMAWFALHPPAQVDVAAFFVVGGLAGQCDSDAFVEAMAEQLTVLSGRPPGAPATTAVRRGRLLELLAAAADRCRAAGRRLVLVIDGLDEDTSPGTGKQSIASLLPRRPAAGLRIVVTSRYDRELPADVPADHPLRGCRPHRIVRSAEAQDVELFAKRELATQLGGGTRHEDLLGLIAGSGGGLARDDLAQLTGASPGDVGDLLRGALGRCVRGSRQRLAGSTGAGKGPGYGYAHDTLRQLAEREFGSRLASYRDRLHAWAGGYRDRGWPPDTPQYLLRDYSRLLAITGQVGRLGALAADRARHERQLEVTGGDALAVDETASAQAAVLAQHPPDLRTGAALALCRSELTRRNTVVPVGLAAVWAALGDTVRAESLAGGAVGAGRRGAALAGAAQAAAAAGNLADAEVLLDRIPERDRRDRALAAVVAEAAWLDLAQAQRLAARLPDGDRRESAAAVIAAVRAATDPARSSGPWPELGDHGGDRTGDRAGGRGGDRAGARGGDRAGGRDGGPGGDRAGGQGDARGDGRAGARSDDRAGGQGDARGDDRADARGDDRADDRRGVRARTELAVALARAGRPAAAEAVVAAAGTGRRGLPSPARARVAAVLAAAGAHPAAERVAAPLRAALIRTRALADLVAAAAASGDSDTAARLLADLDRSARRVREPRAACDVLLPLGTALLAAALPGAAADVARLAEELLDGAPADQDWVAARRLVARAVAGAWPDSGGTVCQAGDPDAAARTTRELALVAEAVGAPQRADALVAAVPEARRRAEVLSALAAAAVARGDRERAAELARAAWRTARGGPDRGRLAADAEHVVDGLVELGDLDEAAGLADRIAEPDRRESALGRVAAALAGAGRTREAGDLAERLAPDRQVWALASIARVLAAAGASAPARSAVERALVLLEPLPDGFTRTAVRLRLVPVLARLGAVDPARSLLRAADRDAGALTDPVRQARAFVLLAAAAGELGMRERAAELDGRAAAALAGLADDATRSRVHARLAEALAEAGQAAAAEEQLRQVTGPAARVRAGCAVAAAGDPARAARWLVEAAALVPAIEPAEDRPAALARVAVTAAAAAPVAGRTPLAELAVRATVELLAGDAWSLAAPALAHLDPEACRALASWVGQHLREAGE